MLPHRHTLSYRHLVEILRPPTNVTQLYLGLAAVSSMEYQCWLCDHKGSGRIEYSMVVGDQEGWEEFLEMVALMTARVSHRGRVGINVD